MKKILLIFIIQIVLFDVGFSQNPSNILNPNKKITQYIIENWTTEDGLPTNSLLSLCQTKNGYLWISGYNGLIRFDGKQFIVFDKNNTPVFKTNVISSMAEDQHGTLWMTTEGSGLVSYKNGVFKSYGEKENIRHTYSLFIDKQNRIWSSSIDSGLFVFENDSFRFFHDKLSIYNIFAIIQDKHGIIWIATQGNGLFKYEKNNFNSFTGKDGLISNYVNDLYFDDDNILWIATDAGICCYDGTSFKTVDLLKKYATRHIIRDNTGSIWISTTEGLLRINHYSNMIEHLSSDNGLSHNYIDDLLFDIEGNLWLTHYRGGLTRIINGKFVNYTETEGLSGKVVNAVCEYDPCVYLVAFDNGYINKIENGEVSVFGTKTYLGGKRIRHLLKDSRNNLWISTYFGLLKIAHNGNESWYSAQNGFPTSKIRIVYEDSNNNIWVGTRNPGLIKIEKNGTFRIFDKSKGLRSNLIMSINEDSAGNLLVGTSGAGLYVLSNEKITENYCIKNGFLSDIIFNTYVDSSGILWVASNGGLSFLYNDRFVDYTTKQGLKDDSPYDIIEDDHGNFWLPCGKGIMKVSRQKLLDFADGLTNNIECVLYNKLDGMEQSECTATAKSLKASDGSIWIPTISGIVRVDPANITANSYIPPVYIEELSIDKTRADLSGSLIIEPGHQRISIRYTALSLFESKKVLFKYFLKGYDDTWSEPVSEREVSYTNLPHGKYTFHVIACNNDGLWNETGDQVSFSVKPKFTETFWFYLILLLSAITVFYAIYRLRTFQIKQRQLVLENLVKERTKEIIMINKTLEEQKAELETTLENLTRTQTQLIQSEKMASVGQLTAGVAHELNNPINYITGGIASISMMLEDFKTVQDKYLEINQDNIYEKLDEIKALQDKLEYPELVSECENLMKSIKNGADKAIEIVQSLRTFSRLDEDKPKLVNIHKNLDATLVMLRNRIENRLEIHKKYGEIPEIECSPGSLNQVFMNIILNAIEAIRGKGTIYIKTLTIENGLKVCIAVKDTGKGMTEETRNQIFEPFFTTKETGKGKGLGLSIAHGIIEEHHGTIEVESKPGSGSEFIIQIPINSENNYSSNK